mgnify:FL=1|tara:strand:- start:1962 stop:2171 length:210 start_codon:yes stop_codon:yes gene_type:complete
MTTEYLGVFALFISLVLLFVFIVFIRNTKKKVDELIKDLQDYTTQIEKEINKLIREINNNNDKLVVKMK